MSKSIIVCALLMYSTCIASRNDQQLALIVHNEARAELGIAPLSYSKKLAKQADAYAKKMAKLDRGLNHSKITKDGENLYMSYSSSGNEVTFSNHPFKDASLSWYREKKDYRYSRIGEEPNFGAIGHYTQMIWETTAHVGFGFARSKTGKTYVVARYAKAGNITGYYPY